MKVCAKFQVDIPNTFGVIGYLQFSVDLRMDGRTEGLRITADKPSLKPRNVDKGQISEDITSEDQT